jgi:hypothetical protein
MPEPSEVEAALALDSAWRASVREKWLRAADLAVFGALASSTIGALPRLRRRVLDLGERLRALCADRAWIPRPREQLKNALACAIAARDALAELETQAADLAGDDAPAFRAALAALREALAPVVGPRTDAWAALLARREDDDDNA